MNIPVYPPPIQPKRQRLTVFFMLMMACSFIQLVPVFAVLMVVLEKPLYQLLKAMEAGQISEETFSQMLTAMMEWWMDKPIVTIATLFGTAGIVGVFVIWQLTMRQRPLSEWGIKGGKKGIAQYVLGLVLGCALFSGAVLFIWAMNGAKLELTGQVNWMYFALFFCAFLVQGFEEEFLLRGFLLHSLKERMSPFWAVLISSVVFALMHISNSGISFVALLNLTLFGVFAGMLVLKTGNLWCAAAIHSTWNFVQGSVWGCLVSGIDVGGGIFTYTPDANRTLTNGGLFGPEGGLGVTLVLIFGIFVLAWLSLPKSQKKAKSKGSEE